jgi:hypothetical protein
MNFISCTIEAVMAQQINPIRATGDPCLARLFGRSFDSISGLKHGNEGLLTRSNSLPNPACVAAYPILSLMNGFQSP